MDRWAWHVKEDQPAEEQRGTVPAVRIYDGEDKTSFDMGNLAISTHRLEWSDGTRKIDLPLKFIQNYEVHGAKFTKSAKITLHLAPPLPPTTPRPCDKSNSNYIKLSFTKGGEKRALGLMEGCLEEKRWEKGVLATKVTTSGLRGGGLVHIERQIENSRLETDRTLNAAFKDIDALMEKGKEMVRLAEGIVNKLAEKQVNAIDDETVQLKSALLSIGIANPVTRDTHGTGTKYHTELGNELCRMLQTPLKECGGVMAVSEVYCRYNRARGMELISPEDVVNACKTLTPERHGMQLKKFASGVLVIEGGDFQSLIDDIISNIRERTCLSAVELAGISSIPLLLAQDRLHAAEQHGVLCRDEASEGTFFYENRFMGEVN